MASEKLDVDASIVVVGGGTFGLSTALHLLRDGYKDVTVVDKYPVPSKFSLACDVNKLVHADYLDEFYLFLALEALEKWKSDPVFKDEFHETGIIYTGSLEDSIEEELKVRTDKLKRNGWSEDRLPLINSKLDFLKYHPQAKGEFTNWKGYYQSFDCGWGHARNSLVNASKEIEKLGGKFIFDAGVKFIFDNDTISGLELESGKIIEASKFVLTAGANSISFNIDFHNQLLAKCWTYAHIKISDEELELLRGTPLIINAESGFFFEPSADNEIKVCNETPGFTHYVGKESIPFVREQIPKQCEDEIRHLLRQSMPQFADRPFDYARICWCTDTVDRNFLICQHPQYKNLILGTGDSGHAFKFMPNIGRYISNVVESGDSSLTPEQRNRWRWKPELAVDRDDSNLRMGGHRKQQDLADMVNWTGE